MEWVWLSLLSAAACSGTAVVQKYCLAGRVRSIFSYAAWAGVIQAALALVVLAFEPWGELRPSWPVLIAVLAGTVRALSLIAQYKGLQSEEEVSRAVPIIDSYPVFVAIFAVAFLDQSLTPTKWLAIAMVVAGVTLVSQHNLLPGRGIRLGKPFFYLLSGSLAIAVFVILAKASLDELSFWRVYALSMLGGAPVLIGAGLARDAHTEVPALLKQPRAFGLIILGEGLLAVAIITCFAAFDSGPVSLVAAITATRPLMVLLYSSFLAILVPRLSLSERLCPQAIMQKLLASSMVVAGVAGMSLGW